MFFGRKKNKNKDNYQEDEMIPVVNEQNTSNNKYRTNYFASKRVKQRGAPRCKSLRKEEIGEYKIEVGLGQLPQSYKVLSNLLIQSENSLEQIDHLVISPYGLFIIEVNNLSGIVLGEETDPNWHQSISWRVKTFPNPLLENQAHLELLRKRVPLDETLHIHSFVTFSRRCDLKVISESVFYDTDLLAVILRRNQQEVLSKGEIQSLYDQIERINIQDINLRNEYAAHIRKQRIRQRPKYGDIRCRMCQKAVSERTARYCINHPDKFAWQIYCVKHQKELARQLKPNSAYRDTSLHTPME